MFVYNDIVILYKLNVLYLYLKIFTCALHCPLYLTVIEAFYHIFSYKNKYRSYVPLICPPGGVACPGLAAHAHHNVIKGRQQVRAAVVQRL